MSLKSEVVPILTNEKISVPWMQSIGKVEPFAKRIDFSKGVSVSKAILKIEATQTYLSGASLEIRLNEAYAGRINWHGGDNQKRTTSYDVSSLLYDGTNKFQVSYNLAFGAITEQTCIMSSQLELLLDVPSNVGKGVEVGKTVETDALSELGQKAMEGIKAIATIAVVVGVAGTAGYVYLKHK